MIKKTLFLIILLYSLTAGQQISNISISFENKDYLIPSYNFEGMVYISLAGLVKPFGYESYHLETEKKLKIDFPEVEIEAVANNPYLIKTIKSSKKSITIQLPTSIHFINKLFYIPLNSAINLLKDLSGINILILNPNRLFATRNLTTEKNQIWSIKLSNVNEETFLQISTLKSAKYLIKKTNEKELFILLNNTSVLPTTKEDYSFQGNVKGIELKSNLGNILIKVNLASAEVAYEIIESGNIGETKFHFFVREESDWYEKDSEHFRLIYKLSHAHLANYILSCAENSFKRLSAIFNYTPKEKIIINTYDVSDYGFGATTNVPQDYIRLEIEALEPGYEAVSYNERIQWLLSHELVHIVVNDQESDVETFIRNIFGKVPPEKIQPFTTIYSVLGNFTRYTPRWYQEGIAVFMETWLSGGYGRTLGNFDEMYFRTLVFQGKKFPTPDDIETIYSHRSIFLENIFYFYGTRFVSYLAVHYGINKVIDWFKTYPNQNFTGFIGKFRDVFGKVFKDEWNNFIKDETQFQTENINLLKTSETTQVKNLSTDNFGWVTQPYYDAKTLSIIFGYHKSANLATLQKFHLLTKRSENFATLPTPSMLQVASTAFDESNNLFFYTTNNNKLFRDVWVIDLFTKDEKVLFPDSRIGNISVSAKTHDFWGVQQQGGISTLVFSEYPYREIIPVFTFDFGEELFHLSVSPSGDRLLAVLHKPNGQQSIVMFNCDELLGEEAVSIRNLTSEGSPENPSWSRDENSIFWNAYTNGVSNIYRYDFRDSSITALTHCITGLFKPIEVSRDSLFAFEFTTDGFLPIMIANKPAIFLPAIRYYGQKIIDKEPKVYDWVLDDADKIVDQSDFEYEKPYNSFKNLHLHSFVPVVSGFQNEVVFGLFTRISDPLLLNDFYLELGVSPIRKARTYPFWHLKFKYDFRQRLYLEYSYNGAEFFDLFNSRKRGMIGSQIKVGHTHYWLYDQPHTIKQELSLSLFTGIEYVNDNLVRVSEPDFGVAVYNIISTNLRRTIGSSDYEYGDQYSLTLTLYSTNFDKPDMLLNGYIDYDRYALWISDHNVAHLKLAGGYLLDNEKVFQGRFFFGGFGNRAVDNDNIRQFRRIFRFPGIPIYSMMATKFLKFMFENDFPPIRVSGWNIDDQYVNHFDFSIYSQSLYTNASQGNFWINLGAQLDIKFKHWYNLESTFSAGIAKAWSGKITDWQWFLSIKLLKD